MWANISFSIIFRYFFNWLTLLGFFLVFGQLNSFKLCLNKLNLSFTFLLSDILAICWLTFFVLLSKPNLFLAFSFCAYSLFVLPTLGYFYIYFYNIFDFYFLFFFSFLMRGMLLFVQRDLRAELFSVCVYTRWDEATFTPEVPQTFSLLEVQRVDEAVWGSVHLSEC